MKGFVYRFWLCSGVLYAWMAVCAPAPATATTGKKILFFVQGGYNSCNTSSRNDLPPLGIKMYPAFQKMVKNLQTKIPGAQVITVSGCLDKTAPPEGEAQYILSDRATFLKEGDTYKIRTELETILKNNPGIPFFIIGHSYGAWMGMFIAEKLAGTPNLQALFTLDPIGPACGAMEVILGESDCHRAPEDRDNRSIRKRAAAWVNFYQNEDSWLSSSEIPEAENHLIEFTWGRHSDISQQGNVWKRIEQVVQKALGVSAPK